MTDEKRIRLVGKPDMTDDEAFMKRFAIPPETTARRERYAKLAMSVHDAVQALDPSEYVGWFNDFSLQEINGMRQFLKRKVLSVAHDCNQTDKFLQSLTPKRIWEGEGHVAERLKEAEHQCEYRPVVGGDEHMLGERCSSGEGLRVCGSERGSEVLCPFHDVVRQVEDVTCIDDGQAFGPEQALALVEAAAKEHGVKVPTLVMALNKVNIRVLGEDD